MTIFGVIFYSMAYYGLKNTAPGLMRIPAEITSEYFTGITVLFTVIIFLSFVGANYVVYRNASGKPDNRY